MAADNEAVIDLVDGLRDKVLGIKDSLATAGDDPPSRERAAANLDALTDQLAKLAGATAGRTNVDLAGMVQNLRTMAQWLRKPTPGSERQVEAFVAQLRDAVNLSDEREQALREAQQSAEIKATVKASLDEIFSKPVPKPF